MTTSASPVADAAPPPPRSSPGGVDMAEAALFFRMSSERMRKRARIVAILLLLTFIVPFDFIGPAPLFLWDGLGEVRFGQGLALLSLPLAGLAILVGSFVARRPSSLAILVFAAIFGAAGVRELGPDRLGWRDFTLPEAAAHHPSFALLALALTAAGANLAHRPVTRRLSKFVLGGAAASALLFLVIPTRGITPIGTVFRVLGTLPSLDGFRYQVALILIALVVLWPVITAGLGLLFVRTPPSKSDPWIVLLATFFPPILLAMFIAPTSLFSVSAPGERSVNVGRGMTFLSSAFVVAAIVSAIAAACMVLVEALSLPEGTQEAAAEIRSDASSFDDDEATEKKPPRRVKPGLPPKIAAAIAAGALVVFSTTSWILARPSRPNLDWTVRARTPDGDKTFGEALSLWSDARNAWENEVRERPSASSAAYTRSLAKELVTSARAVSADLGRAVEALTEGAEGLDIGGRKWTRLIAAVNEASRKASLPYYVEPQVWIYAVSTSAMSDDVKLVRSFKATGFAVDTISRFEVDGTDFATAQVHTLLGNRLAHDRAGFVGEVQPLGLVVVDEVEDEFQRLRSRAENGQCTAAVFAATRDSQGALRSCVAHLAAFVEDDGDTLRDALLAGTERHELQHQIDGPGLNLAKPVQKRLNMFPPSFQDRVNRELSAFLAEMTAAGTAPRLSLLRLFPYAFAFRRGEMTPFYYAATIAFEALTGLVIHKGSGVDGWVEFDKLEDALDKLMAMSDDAVRKRAAEAYDEIFGVALPRVVPSSTPPPNPLP